MKASSKQRRAATKPGRKRSPTTLFVLSKPSEMPAAAVVKAAAERGIKLTPARVHTIRGRYRNESATAEPSASASVKGGGKRYRSASEFVREQPLDMPSKDVVAAGAKLGLKLGQGLVRVIRFHMRHQGQAGRSGIVGQARRGRPPAGLGKGNASAEIQFRRLVIEIGAARASALVAEVEKAIESLVAGR